MGICPVCGKTLDSNGFCFNCGFREKVDPPAVSILKKYLTSPFMLILLALTGVRLILSIIPTWGYDIVGNITYSWGIDIDAVIMLISLLFLYLDGKKPAGTKVNTRGFKIIRTYYIVISAIAAAAVFICSLLILIFGSTITDAINYFIGDFGFALTGSIAVIVGLVFLLVAVLIAVIYFFVIKTVDAVKDVALTGAPNTKISTFLIVVCFIFTFTNIVGIPTAEGGIIDGISMAVEAGVYVTAAIVLIKYRKEMKELHNSLFPKL